MNSDLAMLKHSEKGSNVDLSNHRSSKRLLMNQTAFNNASAKKSRRYQNIESEYSQTKLAPVIFQKENTTQIQKHKKIYGAKALIKRDYKPIKRTTVNDLAAKLELEEHPILNILSDLKSFYMITHKTCFFHKLSEEQTWSFQSGKPI